MADLPASAGGLPADGGVLPGHLAVRDHHSIACQPPYADLQQQAPYISISKATRVFPTHVHARVQTRQALTSVASSAAVCDAPLDGPRGNVQPQRRGRRAAALLPRPLQRLGAPALRGAHQARRLAARAVRWAQHQAPGRACRPARPRPRSAAARAALRSACHRVAV